MCQAAQDQPLGFVGASPAHNPEPALLVWVAKEFPQAVEAFRLTLHLGNF